MNFESVWLNSSIPCAVRELKSISKLYLISADSSDQSENCILDTAVLELQRAAREMFGVEPPVSQYLTTSQVYNKTVDNANVAVLLNVNNQTGDISGSYDISFDPQSRIISITGADAAGVLYGAFRVIFLLRTKTGLEELNETARPTMPMRMLNHWDNMDGSIERGYSGQSFFFKDNKVIVDDRTEAYARMIASVGVNAIVINNVNVRAAATKLITSEYRDELKQLLKIFGRYAVKLYLSLNFAAPIELGGLDNCDPLDEQVRAWWKATLDELFTDVPELGGFLIKADSEGRPGPFTYGRNHADGANMLADIVAEYNAIIIWRCFVYNCKQDWRDTITDRARAQYDNFIELDGKFRDNVILQIKNGPMDFQPREPISPLFGGLKKTNMMIEFQIAQEYTGQQRHVCYLIPWFKEVLDFRMGGCAQDTVCELVSGQTYGNTKCGMCAVTNTGDDANWTGHDLAAANLYGFGRLAFDPSLTSQEIAKEWISLTFGTDIIFLHKISNILMSSWPAYENYTAPLGVGWMVNPGYHYGPNVDGYEFSEWGTYHRSDAEGMGVERGKSGTGFIGQYNEPLASMYENKETCPDELLLFMHHVPYTYRLHSGKTVIQHIYDSHYEGAQTAEAMREEWRSLEGKVEQKVFERALERFDEHVRSACEWRDTVCGYYRAKSGIPDEKGRI